jgi:hypothetical protein
MAAITRTVKFEATGASGIFARMSVNCASKASSGLPRKADRSAAESFRRHSDSLESEDLFSIAEN